MAKKNRRLPIKQGDCVKLKGRPVYGFVRWEPSMHREKKGDRMLVGVMWIGEKERNRDTFLAPSRVSRLRFNSCRRAQHKAYGVTRNGKKVY